MKQLFINGNIYPFSNKKKCSGMIIEDGLIQEIGDAGQLKKTNSNLRIVDLEGRTILPSFTDSHIHFLQYGLGLDMLDAQNCTLEATLSKVAKEAQRKGQGELIIGRGFDYNIWHQGRPQKAWLDNVAPQNPVVLMSKDGHIIWINSLTSEICKIKGKKSPQGGQIERDASGELTGILKETAVSLVMDELPLPTRAQSQQALKKAIKQAHKYGITAIHNMEDELSWTAFQNLRKSDDFNFRAWMTIPEKNLDAALQMGMQTGFGDRHLRIGGVKIFVDGALGSQTAHMLQSYNGVQSKGIRVTSKRKLGDLIDKANGQGIAVAVHAIGDAANQETLTVMVEKANSNLLNRIEHAQLIAPEDMNRFAALNVTASMQPIHCPQDRDIADKYWGSRCVTAYPFRSLQNTSALLIFGSDCPVESCDVLQGIYSAVFRKRFDEPTTSSWYPDEAISVREAIAAYTINPAIAVKEDWYRGNLCPGKYGDFVMLSNDIIENPTKLLETKVLATYFEGKPVFMS